MLLDGVQTPQQNGSKDRLWIDVPASGANGPRHVLDVTYRYPSGERPQGRLQLDAPQWNDDVWVRQTYWQLVLPKDEYLLVAPSDLTAEFAWTWRGLHWERQPLLSLSQLEIRSGAEHDGITPQAGNQYVFCGLGSVPTLQARTIGRSSIVFWASGAVLLVGLALLYLPAVRHRGVLFVIALALIALAALFPDSSLVIAQAAALGMALMVGASLLQNELSRRRRRAVFVRSGGSSIIEPPSNAIAAPDRRRRWSRPRDRACRSTIVRIRRSVMKPPLYTRPWRLGLLASVCVALACSATARQVAAQEPAPPKADPSAALRFRRVFAPADRVQDWPRDAARYVPVAPDEFERLVERARDVPPGATVSPVARTLRAVYQARFDDQVALVGQATLEIGYAGDAPAAMALEPCGLAVGDVSWQGPPKGPATLGLRDDGRLAVLVKAPGQLGFNWSLRGRRDVTGPIAFQLQLPACPATTLFLDLPEDRVPVVERGIVADKTAAGAGRLKWRIELGGLNRLALRLAPRDSGVGPPKPVHFREALTYDVSIRGVNVSAQWKLDVRGEPVRRLEVELDAGLRLLTARYGDADIAWSTLEERDSAPTRLALEFPEPVLGADRVVRLAAVAPLVADKALRLPRIRPRGVVWHEGSVALLVRAPLLINELVPSSCRQTRATPLPAPSSGESIELQCFGPDSAVQIALGRAEQPLQVSAGTTVRLIGGAASAEMVADVRSPAGEHLLMEADVPPGWNIDSVQATPPDALGDWHIDTGDGAASTLHVRLARPVSPNSPVKLQVRGQRPLSSVGGPPAAIPLADLQMLAFHGAASPLRLLALVPDESSQLRLIDAGDASLSSADRLTPYEQALLTDVEHARYLVRLSGDAQSGRVAVENAQPSYKAEVRVLASATAGRLAESYVVRCTPLARPVSRVLVRFTQSRREPLQWTTGDENPQRVHIRRIDNRPNPGDKDDPTGETWEIALTQPRTAPFELRATRSTPHLAELPVALVVLPEAIDHQARLIVDAAADIPLVVRNRGLRQVETEPVALGRYATARAAYRYEPSDAAAGLSIAPAPDAPAQHTAWAWSCQTDSRWEVDGRARCT